MKHILSDNRGAAFRAEPSKGSIEPWGQVEIEVYSYNNLVGIYKDNLVCTVGDTVKTLSVRLGVIGTVVKLSGPQIVSKTNTKTKNPLYNIEMVNFGSRIINPVLGESDGVRVIGNILSHQPDTRKLKNFPQSQLQLKIILHEMSN
jgi:hypothetical protein